MPVRYVTSLADLYGVSVDYLLGRTACRIKLENYQKPIVAGYTADEMLADVQLSTERVGKAFGTISNYR